MWFEKNHGHRFHAALPQSASYHAKMQQDNISRRHERLPIISQLCDASVRLLLLVCTNICISTDLDIFLQLIQSILFEIFNSVQPLYASTITSSDFDYLVTHLWICLNSEKLCNVKELMFWERNFHSSCSQECFVLFTFSRVLLTRFGFCSRFCTRI